jgi:hypothetical protein
MPGHSFFSRVTRRPAAAAVLGVLLLAGCDSSSKSSTVEGTWAGFVNSTYYCESGAQTVELEIDGTAVRITGGTAFGLQVTGTLTRKSDQEYAIVLNDGGALSGLVFFDAARGYALLVIDESPTLAFAQVGVLQKSALSSVTYAESDLVGSWAGVAARIDASYQVTGTSTSTATISNLGGLALSGTDGDGAFSAPVTPGDPDPVPGVVLAYDGTSGLYVSGSNGANAVDWPTETYSAIYALSYDKNVLAAAFLTDLCNYQLTDELPAQKFALWTRQ